MSEMRAVSWFVSGLVFLLVDLLVVSVEAQEVSRSRFAFHSNFGYQFGVDETSDEIEFRAYGETGQLLAAHELVDKRRLDFGGFVQIWEQMSIGATYTQTERTDTTTVTGFVPHPIEYGRNRSIAEVVDRPSRERATHFHIAWLITLPNIEKLDIRVMAGPSYFNVTQGVVSGITISEAGASFDSVLVNEVVTGDIVKNGLGGHIGVDLSYMVHPYIGLGGFVRFTGGSVDLPKGDTTVSTSIGGFQGGGGVRFRF